MLILLLSFIPQNSFSQTTNDKPCNCVIFRLDDVRNDWLVNVQMNVMDQFISKNQSLSLGIIIHNMDNNSKIFEKINEEKQKGLFELAIHGWDHVDYTQLSSDEQLQTIQQANQKMQELFGTPSIIFIPPYDKFNGYTIGALKSVGIRIISSSTTQDKTDYFVTNVKSSLDNPNTTLYHMPSMLSYKTELINSTWLSVPMPQILSEIDDNIAKYGYAVVMLHPQNFAKMENGRYVDVLDDGEVGNLKNLIDSMRVKNIQITSFSNVSGLKPEIFASTFITNEAGFSQKNEKTSLSIKNSNHEITKSCHCVAFRLDDIQDYYLNSVQIAVIDTFQQKKANLTIGVIGNAFGSDVKLVSYIKEKIKKQNPQIEIANHGWNHEDFTQFSSEQQSILMKKTNDKIYNIFGITPSIFIPPYDAINSNTMTAFLENNFQYISANVTEDPPQHINKNALVYHLPVTAITGDLSDNDTYWYSKSYQQTFAEVTASLQKYGYAVVMMHPFEYSIRHGMNMDNKVNWNQIHQLELLIDKIRQSGLKMVIISDIPKHITNQKIPAWTGNLFTWYNDGKISENELYASFNYLLAKKIAYL